jgi:hypothetical protein
MALIYYVTQIQFEFGAIKLLKSECERVGIMRPLIVTDPGVKAAGLLDKALNALPGLQVAVFDQTPSNPTEAAVRAATAVYKPRAAMASLPWAVAVRLTAPKGSPLLPPMKAHSPPTPRSKAVQPASPTA